MCPADRLSGGVRARAEVCQIILCRASGGLIISTLRLAILLTALIAASCGARADQPPKASEPSVAWRPLGSWSGHGNRQTESFTSDTGTLRVRWETTAESTDPGAFRLTAHSAISGRPLQQIVDHPGAGSGIGYVQQDPHVFYVVVESNHVNWKFTVEEAVGYGG